MPEITTYLSPNGDNLTHGDGPATRILAATLEGIVTLGRKSASSPWDMAGRSLSDRHIGSLVFEPGSGKLFAGAHANGGRAWDHLTRRGDRMGYPDFLFFDPADDRTVFMAGSYKNPGAWFSDGSADSSVMRSIDSGDSWTELGQGLPSPMVGAIEAMTMHCWAGGMMLVIGTATGEIHATEDGGASWACIADDVRPVSKDDHHLPFLSEEQRREAMAVRKLL